MFYDILTWSVLIYVFGSITKRLILPQDHQAFNASRITEVNSNTVSDVDIPRGFTKYDLDLAMAETLKALDDGKKRIVIVAYEDGSYGVNAFDRDAIELAKAGILNPPPAMAIDIEGVFTLNNRWRKFIDGNTGAIYDDCTSV